jgi:hypothetical protein
MQYKKIILTLLTIPIMILLAFQFAIKKVDAQSTTYPLATLTTNNDFNFLLQVQAVKYEAGKWTYNFVWNRTRDAQGTVVISPKVNELFRSAELDPAPKQKTTTDPLVVKLDPATRYVFKYYAVPGCDQASVANDPECVAIRSIYFNTRDASGKTMETSEIPLSQGGTKADASGGSSSNIVPTSLDGLSNTELTAIVAKLFAMVEALIRQMSTGTTLITTTSTTTGTTLAPTNPTTIANPNDSVCPFMVGKILYGCFVNVFKSNPGTGEPQYLFREIFQSGADSILLANRPFLKCLGNQLICSLLAKSCGFKVCTFTNHASLGA